MIVRKGNGVDLIRLLLQGLPCVSSISSQLLMKLPKWLLEITEDPYQSDLGMSCLFWLL